VVASRGSDDLTATTLKFVAGGCEIGFDDGSVVRLSLGGAWFGWTGFSGAAQGRADRSWSYDVGEVAFTGRALSFEAKCPADTWPISLSTWEGGWLLVCGTSSSSVTSMVYDDDDEGPGLLTGVTEDGNGYCATTNTSVIVCAYRSPAVVSFSPPFGDRVQRAVASNFFPGSGSGGAGRGTGDYGAAAPKDTAEDQVRYLVDILNSSAKARAPLNDLYLAVEGCSATSATVAGIEAIRDNREQLIEALSRTPVDKVEGGQALVATLAEALGHSRDDDAKIAEWGHHVLNGGCNTGKGRYFADHRAASDAAQVSKKAFVNQWNSTIAPKYGVPTFTAQQI
jgi:hypothetical protein